MVASAEPPRTVKSSPVTTTGRPSIRARPKTQLDGVTWVRFAVLIVLADPGGCTDLVKAFGVDEPVNALAYRQAATIVLTFDFVGAAHLVGEGLSSSKFVELGLPAHIDFLFLDGFERSAV